MPTPDTVKAKIRQAAEQARLRLYDLDDEILAHLQSLYQGAQLAIAQELAGFADTNGNVRQEYLALLQVQVDTKLAELAKQQRSLLADTLNAAAALGAGVWTVETAGIGFNPTRLADDAVQFVQGFIAADGLQLSDRIWRLENGAREAVAAALQRNIILGNDAGTAAAGFLARGEPIPAEIAARLGLSRADQLALAAGDALLQAQGNPYAMAKRVFRTELNRAHVMAYVAGLQDNPDVAGVRFMLSPRHPRPDICDLHAQANLHGLGAGVYPLDRHPWPAHPNTFSYLEAVFWDEVSPQDQAGQQSQLEWLQSQPPEVQLAVLGSEQKFLQFQQGLLTTVAA